MNINLASAIDAGLVTSGFDSLFALQSVDKLQCFTLGKLLDVHLFQDTLATKNTSPLAGLKPSVLLAK